MQSLTGFCGRLCSAYAAPLQGGSLRLCTASGEAPRRRCVCAASAAGVAAEAVQRLCEAVHRLCIGCAEAAPRGARRCRGADKRSAPGAPARRGAMSQSEEKSAYELERQDNMRQNREKLLALGILDSPAPTSRTGKKRPRPPAGEKTREQPKRGAGGEGARPSYRESPPPASARHPAASPANGAAAPAMDASAGAASEAAQAEAASAADELCANRSRFVLRRNPSATVVRAVAPLQPAGTARRRPSPPTPAPRPSPSSFGRSARRCRACDRRRPCTLPATARRSSRWPGCRTVVGCVSSWRGLPRITSAPGRVPRTGVKSCPSTMWSEDRSVGSVPQVGVGHGWAGPVSGTRHTRK